MRIASIIVTTSLMSSLALGCDVESVDGSASSAQAISITQRAGTSEELAQAMDTIDLMVQGLTTIPNPEVPWLIGQLEDLAMEIDYQALDQDEREELNAYVQSKSEEVLPVLTSLHNAGLPFDEFGPPILTPGFCPSYCLVFLEFACEDSTFMGLCFGVWDCDDGLGAHECGNAAPVLPDDCGGDICGPGERCARWAFKKHECVETCNSNADCSNGESCKQPFGTSFKRCK